MNAETGAILYQKNAFAPSYPASTTKIATILYILEHKKLDPQKKITISADAVQKKNDRNRLHAPIHWMETDGTNIGLMAGEVLTADALLHGLMMRSGNDAANALAEAVSGSVPQFMEELNAYLKSIGCTNTHYYNPHGYHYPDHMTTAFDLALMMQRGLRLPQFLEILGKETYLRHKTNKRAAIEFKQANGLIVKDHSYYYPKAIGSKTGFHSYAGSVLVAAATHEGRTLIAVTMGHDKKAEANAEVCRLFEAAFSETKLARTLIAAPHYCTKHIPGADKKLQAFSYQDLEIFYYPSEEPEPKAFIQWAPITLPIHKGDKVGQLQVFDERDSLIGAVDLVARENIAKTWAFTLREKWNMFFN